MNDRQRPRTILAKRVRIALAAATLLLIGYLLYSWFGPAPGIIVSRETTFVTEPLGADGLPNLPQAILQRSREGVTPENNGAIPFWQALGAGDMDRKDFALLCREIGLDPDDANACLVPTYDRSVIEPLAAWIVDQRGESDSEPQDNVELSEDGIDENAPVSVAEAIVGWSSTNPWAADDAPRLAGWGAENEAPLDLLVSAAAKSEFYTPSPSLLKQSPYALTVADLPEAQALRTAQHALQTRCMYRVTSKDYAGAWADCRACWQLGDHVGRGWSLRHSFIGLACRGTAMHATQTLLDQDDLPTEIAQQILADLRAFSPRIDLSEVMNLGERLAFVEVVITLKDGGVLSALANSPEFVRHFDRFDVDLNVILRRGNALYDQLFAAASLDDRVARNAALQAFDYRTDQIGQVNGMRLVRSLLSRPTRDDLVGDAMLSLLLPATGALFEALDRDEGNSTLIQTAAALAI
ncbi:MAG: hypothetical protein AAF961_05120, partial [Planctomycetota bacterium]